MPASGRSARRTDVGGPTPDRLPVGRESAAGASGFTRQVCSDSDFEGRLFRLRLAARHPPALLRRLVVVALLGLAAIALDHEAVEMQSVTGQAFAE